MVQVASAEWRWARVGRLGCLAAAIGLTACASPLEEANRRAANERVTEVRATTPFDAASARAALGPGKSQIVGTVYAVENAPKSYDPGATAKVFKEGVQVYLYPMTAHLREYLALRKELDSPPSLFKPRRGPGQHTLVASDEMMKVRREARTDKFGRFSFNNIKPGDYHVTLQYKHTFHSMQNVRTATVVGQYDRAGVYETREFSEPVEALMFENVTVGRDGSSEEVSFSKRGTRNFRAPQ